MFIATLFIVTKTRKQSVSIDRGMDKENVVYVYTHTDTHSRTLLSHEKERHFAIRSNVDGPRDGHGK